MKIVFIIPPMPYFIDQKRNVSLGILYIAAHVERYGYDVSMIDLRHVEEDDWLSRVPIADVYGLTASSPEYTSALKIAQKLKSRNECKIVLGGFHATAFRDEIDMVFDKIVLGEGELSMLDVLNDLNGDKRFYANPLIKDLDILSFPARHLLPEDSFINDKLVIDGERSTPIMVSRGCAFNCSFCASKTMWNRRVRFRSVDNVIKEFKEIIDKYGVYHFRFQDDTISINKKWLFAFCEKLKSLNVTWRVNTRVDLSDENVLQAMYDAGCYEICYGVEDPDERVLSINNKKLNDIEIAYKAIRDAKKIGLKTRIYLMIGLPGQDEDVDKIFIDFIKRAEPDGVDLSTFVPLPGCDIAKNPDKYNIEILDDDFEKYIFFEKFGTSEKELDFMYKHDKLTNEQLKEKRNNILDYIKERNMVANL